MARRTLMLAIETKDAKHCGQCSGVSVSDFPNGERDFACSVFRIRLEHPENIFRRCDACLRAETFAGG